MPVFVTLERDETIGWPTRHRLVSTSEFRVYGVQAARACLAALAAKQACVVLDITKESGHARRATYSFGASENQNLVNIEPLARRAGA